MRESVGLLERKRTHELALGRDVILHVGLGLPGQEPEGRVEAGDVGQQGRLAGQLRRHLPRRLHRAEHLGAAIEEEHVLVADGRGVRLAGGRGEACERLRHRRLDRGRQRLGRLRELREALRLGPG